MEDSKNEVIDWLKHHSLSDMKSLAREMSDSGEDISDLIEIINEFESIASTEGVAIAQ